VTAIDQVHYTMSPSITRGASNRSICEYDRYY
jgi:hypothetical protein